MKANAKIHMKVFQKIRKVIKEWVSAVDVDKICWDIAKKHSVLCGFRWVYWFPDNICISVNDVVVHWRARKDINRYITT